MSRIIDKSKPILVNCHAGSRGAIAATELARLAFKTVWNVEGGVSPLGEKARDKAEGAEVRNVDLLKATCFACGGSGAFCFAHRALTELRSRGQQLFLVPRSEETHSAGSLWIMKERDDSSYLPARTTQYS
jgi:hypothetical protein